ncbi:hypothetical protein Micbo1qcDRAFT_163537, partial [Microdochium bolleyi]
MLSPVSIFPVATSSFPLAKNRTRDKQASEAQIMCTPFCTRWDFLLLLLLLLLLLGGRKSATYTYLYTTTTTSNEPTTIMMLNNNYYDDDDGMSPQKVAHLAHDLTNINATGE